MNPKALLIPIAAFALSATSVSASGVSILQNAGLSSRQIEAFQTAHKLKDKGDMSGAREALEKADIGIDVIESIREAIQEYKEAVTISSFKTSGPLSQTQ